MATGDGDGFDRLARRLCFRAGAWESLPEWGRYLVRVGGCTASYRSADARVVVVMTLPSRAYAAALCAAGVVMEGLSRPVAQDAAASLERLRHLVGQRVRYRSGSHGDRIGRGTLVGFEHSGGIERAMIKTSKGKDAIGIPAARAHFIEPFENDDRELPEHGYTYRRHEDLGFLEALLEPAEKASLTQGSRLDCLLIGNRSLQANEIEEPSFAVTVSGGDWLRGRLKDALRVRSLGCHMNYRTEVLSGEMGKAPSFLRETEPIVIFDGARHFVRWHLQLPLACGWVVMLDRTDRRTDEALAILEDLYVMKRLDDDHADAFPSPQAEIRFKTFKTRRGV